MIPPVSASSRPLLEVIDLKVHFPVRRGVLRRATGLVRAVDGVSLKIERGRTLGLVGESGCGKSTLGRAIVGLTSPTAGDVIFRGRNMANLTAAERQAERRRVQMIFQDPYASLNPRMTVGEAIAEPVQLHGLRIGAAAIRDRVAELLDLVGLDPAMARRYPHEFSGGQRQRVGIARALACEPDLIVCDEAVSALDVSIQAQVIRLLEDLQASLGLTYLFIAHGLGVVKHLCEEVAVMYLGRIVEQGGRDLLFSDPRHAYTRALVSAVPVPDPAIERRRHRIILAGDLPSPLSPPAGCRFHTRCPVAMDACKAADMRLEPAGVDHATACLRAADLDRLMPLQLAAAR